MNNQVISLLILILTMTLFIIFLETFPRFIYYLIKKNIKEKRKYAILSSIALLLIVIGFIFNSTTLLESLVSIVYGQDTEVQRSIFDWLGWIVGGIVVYGILHIPYAIYLGIAKKPQFKKIIFKISILYSLVVIYFSITAGSLYIGYSPLTTSDRILNGILIALISFTPLMLAYSIYFLIKILKEK